MNTAHGHLWTVGPYLRHAIKAAQPPRSVLWHTPVDEHVRLTGRLSLHPDAQALVVLVHGLGGSAYARYMVAAARGAQALGMSSLRINLRGADRRGDGIYHAGLVEDLQAVLRSPIAQAHASVHMLGFSLGGHVTLRHATLDPDRKLKSVAAVCAPLDLKASASDIDRPYAAPYRRNVLTGLKDIFRQVADRRTVPISVDEADQITTIRDWDDRVVAPRFGFADAVDYWHKMSVGPRLSELQVPALYVTAAHDPMVRLDSVTPTLQQSQGALEVVVSQRGGHVGFPAGTDLGLGQSGDVYMQILGWLRHNV